MDDYTMRMLVGRSADVAAVSAQLRTAMEAAAAMPDLRQLPGIDAVHSRITESAVLGMRATPLPALALQIARDSVSMVDYKTMTSIATFADEMNKQLLVRDGHVATLALEMNKQLLERHGHLFSAAQAVAARFVTPPTLDLAMVVPTFAALTANLQPRLATAGIDLDLDEIVDAVDSLDVESITEVDIEEAAKRAAFAPSPLIVAALVCALALIGSGQFMAYLIEHQVQPDQDSLLMYAFTLLTADFGATMGAYKMTKKRQGNASDEA